MTALQPGPEEALDAPVTRILVVEDNEALGRVLASTIRGLGASAVVVGTVAGALEQLAGPGCWSGIILDMSLPDGSGRTVLAWLGKRHSDVPVLVHTGHPDHDIIAEAYDAKAQYLEKPATRARIGRFVRLADAYAREHHPGGATPVADPEDATAAAWKQRYGLSDAELDILVRSARGQTRETVAAQRAVSVNTLRKQVQSLLDKAGTDSLRATVERFALELGLARTTP
jgi:DNA-binding NarL/FixJ family response regulator